MKLRLFYNVVLLLTALFTVTTAGAQFKVETFGKFEKVKGGAPDKPIDFKTSFPLKSQVYVQLTCPVVPEFYTIDCYLIKNDGTEKLVGTTDIKHFEKEPAKTIKSNQSLGMMYDMGNYKIKAWRQSDKKVIAETAFAVTGEAAAPARTVATVMFSNDTDDNFNPIPKALTTISKGDGVNFSAKMKEGIGAKFFIWAVFEIKADGDEVLFKDMQMNVDNETNRWFATTDKTYFTKPGKYAVYMLKQNATNNGMTVRKPTEFYARGVLEVK